MVKATVESYIEGDAGALTEEIEYQIKGAAGTLYIGASSPPRLTSQHEPVSSQRSHRDGTRSILSPTHRRLAALIATLPGPPHQTLATLCVCIFQFVMHPDVLEKAQAEIDRVVGSARLPDFDDRPSLPYLECVIREVFRCVVLPVSQLRFTLMV